MKYSTSIYFPMKVKALLLWGLSLLFYFYENLLQVFPSIIKPELTQAFDLNGETFGTLTALCVYAYGVMQIPVGILVDRFGPRSMLTIACGLSALGSLVFASAEVLWVAKMGRILMGIGGAFAFVSSMKIALTYFTPRSITLLLGITVTVGFLGAFTGLSLLSQFIENMNWRFLLIWCGILGVILSVFIWFFTRHIVFIPSDSTKPFLSSTFEGLMYLIQRKTTWVAAFYGCFMFVPTQIFGASWGVSFLDEAHGLGRSFAGMSCALLYGGWMLGAPLWGWLSSYYKSYYPILGLTTVLTFFFVLMLMYGHSLSLLSIFILLFGIGLFSSAYLLVFVIIQSMTPLYFAGTALGVLNSINSLCAFADPLVGYVLDRGSHLPVLIEYQFALLIVPLFLFSALPLLLYLAVLENKHVIKPVIFEHHIGIETE